jgi:hypothetical protein
LSTHIASNPGGFSSPASSATIGGGGNARLWLEMVVLYNAERGREREKGGGFFYCADHFALAKMYHVRQFNVKENINTKESNGAIDQVPLDSLKKIGYQKVHFMILWVPFQDFTCVKLFF